MRARMNQVGEPLANVFPGEEEGAREQGGGGELKAGTFSHPALAPST